MIRILEGSPAPKLNVEAPALRPDGSHYEFNTHNPAADAFIELLNETLRAPRA